MSRVFTALKRAGQDFMEDECMASAAAIAYYTIFSLPPLLVLVFYVAGLFGVSQQQVARIAQDQVGIPVEQASSADAGPASGDQAEEAATDETPSEAGGLTAVASRAEEGSSVSGLGPLSRIVGIALIIFSATGVFVQLQTALNRAWEVEPDPDQGGVFSFLLKRMLSLGMIVVIAFLLLVSLVLTAMTDELVQLVLGRSPGTVATAVGWVINTLASLVVATLLFAAMYKLLPDGKLEWRDAIFGAAATAIMFVIGKALIGWWLQRSEQGANWGTAAGSLIAVLVWVYYTSLIVLFGAELTQSWANLSGRQVEPEKGAVKMKEVKEYIRDPQPGTSS